MSRPPAHVVTKDYAHTTNRQRHFDFLKVKWAFKSQFKGFYADNILIPQGSTGSSIFFDTK